MTDKQVKKGNLVKLKCKVCGTYRGVIKKYGLEICRRCFKDNAENIGFRKYD